MLLFIALLSISAYAQDDNTYESALYINDVAISEMPRFVELHKKFTQTTKSQFTYNSLMMISLNWLNRPLNSSKFIN
jgi:hypothetical protein